MCTFLLQVITAWKDQVPMFTQSYYMKKKSNLTPFIAHEIKKMKEKGITNVLTKRHIMPEPNCEPPSSKGVSLGMEKFASLFVFYINCCIVSLITLRFRINVVPRLLILEGFSHHHAPYSGHHDYYFQPFLNH